MMMMKNKIYLGDCLDVMKDIEDKSIDMILCDLPYGITACKWDTIIPFEPLWEQYKRIIKNRGSICLFGNEPFSSCLRMSNLKWYKYDWIWEKDKATGFGFCKYQPLRKYTNICIFYKKQCTYNPQLIDKPKKNIRGISIASNGKQAHYKMERKAEKRTIPIEKGYPTNVLRYNREVKTVHPTQKPVKLLEYLIKTYTQESELILDNCVGSGSTAVAAINTGRNYIGIEKEEKYYNIANKRIEDIKNVYKEGENNV